MIWSSAPNAPKGIIHVHDEYLCVRGSEVLASTKCDIASTINAVQFKPPKCGDEQVDRHYAVNNSDGNVKPDWWEDLRVPDASSAFSKKFLSMLEQV